MATKIPTVFSLLVKGILSPDGDEDGGAIVSQRVDESMGSGTGDRQCDGLLLDERTLAASTSEDLDFSALTDANGNAFGPAEIAIFVLHALETNGSTLSVTFAAVNPWLGLFGTGTDITMPAGSTLAFVAPLNGGPAVSGTSKVITVANDDGAASAKYRLLMAGRSS